VEGRGKKSRERGRKGRKVKRKGREGGKRRDTTLQAFRHQWHCYAEYVVSYGYLAKNSVNQPVCANC